MNLIFNFIYDFDIVSDILRPELIKYYDFMIVDKEIIERLKHNYDLYGDFVQQIERQALGGNEDLPVKTAAAVISDKGMQ